MASVASIASAASATSVALLAEHRALESSQLATSGEAHLKSTYLDCAREATSNRMDVDQAQFCQAVADALVSRHFGGDLDRLIHWWHGTRADAPDPGA